MATELRRSLEAAPSRIRVLPPEVANRIAAGEVIERPASVVKELVENAVDAGARHVEVLLESGGIDRIQVHDDGHGIPPEQLADAFERHATSKLRSAEELFAIGTLGFRGEALAAVAAAADVDLVTRPPAQGAAASVRLRGGRLVRQGSAAAGEGTRIDVRDLFASLPARRRFLRSARAEATAAVRVVAELALAYPTIAFRVTADGRVALDAPGASEGVPDAVALREAMAAVHGRAFADPLVEVPPLRWWDDEGEARVEVEGLISPPHLHRAHRRYLHLIANGRAIRARELTFAVERAFEGRLLAGRHPGGVLRIAVPPEQVDVNVHPTKAEVRFRHERAVFSAVTRAVTAALDGASAPLAPTFAGASDAPETLEAARRRVLTEAGTPAGVPFEASPHAQAAPNGGAELPLAERLPALRSLGQFDSTYLVAESPDGLVLVDQHAAHERVLYERFGAAREARVVAAQPLLETVVVDLGGPLAALVDEQREVLADLGWSIDAADGGAVLLRAVPVALERRDPARALQEYLDQLLAEERLTGPDRAVATLACRAAVMAGDRLDAEQQRALLRDLEDCAAPHTCPHGRPTTLHLSSDQLERSFGRR